MRRRLFFIVILAALTVWFSKSLTATASMAKSPSIEFTYVPPYGSSDDLQGRVRDVDPPNYDVAVYIYVEYAGWWTKPTFAQPLTPIQPDCTWVCDITTGGSDSCATEMCAFLLPDGVDPPLAEGDEALPDTLWTLSVASVCTTRSPPTLSFSGYQWRVKSSDTPVGPGPNYFSDGLDNVWVDEEDRLHLKITERDGKWYCAEVYLTESLGYGKYLFGLASRVGQLDPNVVLGLFTWDDAPEENHREIDIEFSRWGTVADSNAQYVIQPWDHSGNMHRWMMPESLDSSTHSFEWRPDSIRFIGVEGHQVAAPRDSILQSWDYTGSDIPTYGDENARINLWLNNGQAPTDSLEVEVIIASFQHDSLTLESIDDLNVSLTGEDIFLWWTEPSADAGVDHYVVFRSTSADSSGDSLANTVDTAYKDVGAAGTVGVSYYYTIRAVDSIGQKSGESNKVGEFDRSLGNIK